MNATGMCDNGSDDSLASSSVAQQAVLKGIGRLDDIQPITIQVALTSTDKQKRSNSQEFGKYRLW